MHTRADVAIVGGGLAGLAAAAALPGLDVVVLEREGQLGGRVLTRTREGVVYELGATFGYNRVALPPGAESSPVLREAGPIGLCAGGRLALGASVRECLQGLGLAPSRMAEVDAFAAGTVDAAGLSAEVYSLLAAFFRVIHPGELREYLPRRQRDALLRFSNHFVERGNQELVQAYLQRGAPRVETGAQVTGVEEEGEQVRVSFRVGAAERSLTARAAILTTPAPLTARLLRAPEPAPRRFLESVRYGSGSVVVLALRQPELVPFSYVVTADLPVTTVLRRGFEARGLVLLTLFFVGESSQVLQAMEHSAVAGYCLELLQGLPLGRVEPSQLVFHDVQHWPLLGPVVDQLAYGAWSEENLRPTPRTRLAGDYVHLGDGKLMPYGTMAALQSGARAAREVQSLLGGDGR